MPHRHGRPYHRTDADWNDLGAFFVARALLKEAHKRVPALRPSALADLHLRALDGYLGTLADAPKLELLDGELVPCERRGRERGGRLRSTRAAFTRCGCRSSPISPRRGLRPCVCTRTPSPRRRRASPSWASRRHCRSCAGWPSEHATHHPVLLAGPAVRPARARGAAGRDSPDTRNGSVRLAIGPSRPATSAQGTALLEIPFNPALERSARHPPNRYGNVWRFGAELPDTVGEHLAQVELRSCARPSRRPAARVPPSLGPANARHTGP